MKNELLWPFDAAYLQKNKKRIRRELLLDKTKRIVKRIAILGGSTTDEIKDMMELFLLNNGIEPLFYQSDFNKYWEDVMFDNAELKEFGPDIIFIHTSMRNISYKVDMSLSTEQIDDLLNAEYQRFEIMWNKISETYGCVIIQNNFDYNFFRLLGNKDIYDLHGMNNFLAKLNEKFYSFAQKNENFFINDLNWMQSYFGINIFSDPKYWYLYKYIVAVPLIPYFAFNVVNIIKSIYGKNKKALVLDLDNTLWGGVIGDDGIEGIQIGHETSMGQAYNEFQSYIKNHLQLGIMLAVNSKNDEENAIAGLNHPEGTLKPDDFIVIKANWEPKSLNLKRIASSINIGEDSLVFVDDNPAEREICYQNNPFTVSPNIGQVTDYIRNLDMSGFFETTIFSIDDLKRNEMYKSNVKRAELEASFDNYDEYLKSLNMKAVVREFDDIYLPRIAQLTNKSNQFNLTTKRFSDADIKIASNDKDRICLYGKLSDKFGDNGVITVVIGRKENADILGIELWLMSCRVLKRGMENAMLDSLVKCAKKRGYSKLKGYYFKTEKNNMVRFFYRDFGFTLLEENENLDSIWELDIREYKNKNLFIEVTENE